jgi:hypothetical protein
MRIDENEMIVGSAQAAIGAAFVLRCSIKRIPFPLFLSP